VDSIVIVGAGAAGLSVAYYLAQLDTTHEFSCTLIEPDTKADYDRTWSYWGGPFDFDDLVAHEWDKLLLRYRGSIATGTLRGPGYRFIPSNRFYRRCLDAIAADPRFSFVRGRAEFLHSDASGATVGVRPAGPQIDVTDSDDGVARHRADYVVDSVFGPTPRGTPPAPEPAPDAVPAPVPAPAFYQTFVGWEIERDAAEWRPDTVTLMDFSDCAGPGRMEFFYTLPFAEERALVEFTTVGPGEPETEYLENRLEEYLVGLFGDQGWNVTHREKGSIPLFESREPTEDANGRIVHLGVRAGAARPTTGYAFRSIVETSAAIVEEYEHTGLIRSPESIGSRAMPAHRRGRPRFYDRVFLEVLAGEPDSLPPALVSLFRRNRAERVFRFLAGRSSLIDELSVIISLPWGPFLRALRRTIVRSRRRPEADTTLYPESNRA
jgi:lycopene beta-cyclase